MGIVELNKLNQLRSLVIAKTMSKDVSYGRVRYKCKGNLITDYTASGVKSVDPVASIGKRNMGFWEFLPLFAGEQMKPIPLC